MRNGLSVASWRRCVLLLIKLEESIRKENGSKTETGRSDAPSHAVRQRLTRSVTEGKHAMTALTNMSTEEYEMIRKAGLLPPSHHAVKTELGYGLSEHDYRYNRRNPLDPKLKKRFEYLGWDIEVVSRAENFQHRIWVHCKFCCEKHTITNHICEEMLIAAKAKR